MRIEETTISPNVWGPSFWRLLNQIVRYSHDFPHNLLDDFVKLFTVLQDVLPCPLCRQHCGSIYAANNNFLSQLTLHNSIKWLYTFRSYVNKYAKSETISYHDYIKMLHSHHHLISKNEVLDLLALITLNYPHGSDEISSKRRASIFIFIKTLSKLVKYIPHLRDLEILEPSVVWANRVELKKWLKKKARHISHHHLHFRIKH